MAFVNAKTGKQIKLEKGYLSNPVDYQTFLKQQEAKRQSAASAPAAAAAQKTKAKGTASGMNRVEGLPSARPSVVSLENQKRQAQVDQDTDSILRLNKQLKEERSRRGRQTVGDRVSDVASAVFGGSGGSLANLAGFTSNLFQDPEADRRSIARAQEALRTGRTSDGRPINDAQRKTLEESIARLSAHAAKLEAPDSFTNRAYRAADRMADTGAAFQESAKQGLGKVGSTVVDAATSMGQSALDAAIGAATGTGMLPFVARSLGGGAQEARRGGADLDEQLLYGSAQAAKEYVTEKLFGLAVPQRMLGKAGAGSLDDAIETGIRNVTERLAKTPAGQKAVGGLLTWLAGGATEGLEEGIGSVIENTLINPNLRDWDPDTRTRQQKFEDGLYDMLVGGVSGLMGVTNLAQYQVSPADAHVRRTFDMMNRAAGRETAPGSAQEAPGARFEAGQGTDTTPSQSAAQAAQIGPENIFIKTAADAKAEKDRKVRGTLELMQRTAGMETAQRKTGIINPENMARYRADIDKVFSGSYPSGRVIEIGATPPILQKYGANPHRITLSQDTAYKIAYPEGYFGGKHNLGMSVLKQLPYQLENPVAILKSNTQKDSLVILTEWIDGDKSIIVPVHLNKTGAIELENRVASTYQTKHIQSYLGDGDRNVLYTRNNEDIHQLLSKGVQFPQAMADDILAQNSIPQSGETVNPQETGGDGLGAADAGSLNSDYDRLQAQSSRFHPEGPNAARPVDVPTQDFEGYNIPKSASTMMGAASLHSENVRQLEQMVADGILSFGTIHDGDALLYANKILQEKGFDAALERYRNDVQSNVATKGNTVLGQLLMRDAAARGNADALAEIFQLYAANSTTIAQAMQAQSMLRKLPPESQLVPLQKALDTLNEKYQLDLKMDQADVKAFMEAENQEARDAVRQRMVEKAAKEVPSTFRAKYDAVRYLAMLGNPRTHIRNIVGNLAFQVPATVKNRVGALAERGAQALGADVERTKSLTGANPFGALAREARADWANAKPFLEGGKYSEGKVTAGAIEREAKPFQSSGALGKAVGWASDKNGALLEAEDTLFKKWIYSQSLAGYLQANGVKSISEADPALLNRARNYAAQEALRNTFNDRNDFSDFVAKLGNLRNSKNKTARAASYLTEGLLPFKRTPANVAARAVEYSPVGAAASAIDLLNKGAHGKATAETVAKGLDRLAAGLSGTALLGLGFLASGMVTGGEDEDKDQQKFNDLTGHQTYALETPGGTSITLDWLAPSAIPFFMGVELAHAMQDGGVSWEDAVNTLKNMSEPMLEMSMLQGLNDVFENAAYAQQHGGSVMGAAVVSAATNYLTQVFPTLFGQLERSTEGTRMTTYADKNDRFSKDLQFFLGKTSQKVPGWDYHQIPYLDAWGREEDNGDPVKRVFNNLINPAYVSQVKVDAVEKELQRVADTTGNTGVFPSRAKQSFTFSKTDAKGKPVKDSNGNTIPVTKDLSAWEYQTYAKRRGQASVEVLQSMLNSPVYQKLSDEKKAEAISYAYQYADSIGKMAVSDYRPGDGTIAAGALKTMLPPAGYILLQLNKDRDGDGKVTNLEETQTLQELPDLSGEQRGKAWAAMNKRTKQAKNPFTGVLSEQGMTPEEAASAWKIYDGKGTEDDPYTKSEKIRDLQEEFGLSYIDAAQIYRLMKKAAEKK